MPYRYLDGICDLCCGDSGHDALCRSCRKHTRALDLDLTELSVFPLGLAMKRSPLAIALWRYKRADSAADRSKATDELRSIIDERLPPIAAHIDDCDLVTFVPGRQSRTSPVLELFSDTSLTDAHDIQPILEVLDYDGDTHTADTHRFRSRRVEGNVLLLDDTFTTGATSYSAARALLNAGAGHVTIVVIGRHSDPDWLSETYKQHVSERQEVGEFCPECSIEIRDHEIDYDDFDPGASPAPDPWATVRDTAPWTPSPMLPGSAMSKASIATPPLPPEMAPTTPAGVGQSVGAGVKRGLRWIGWGLFAVVGFAMWIDQSTVSVPNDQRNESVENPIRDSASGRKAAIDLISANASKYDMAGVPRGPIAEGIQYVCADYIAKGRDLADYASDMESFATSDADRDTLPFLNYIGEVVFRSSDTIC